MGAVLKIGHPHAEDFLDLGVPSFQETHGDDPVVEPIVMGHTGTTTELLVATQQTLADPPSWCSNPDSYGDSTGAGLVSIVAVVAVC